MNMSGEKAAIGKEEVVMSLMTLYRLGNNEGDCVILCE
jgi:hypothetical protein